MSLLVEIEQFVAANGTLVAVSVAVVVFFSLIIYYSFSGPSEDGENDRTSEEKTEQPVTKANGSHAEKSNGHQRVGKTSSAPKQQRTKQQSSNSTPSPCITAAFRGHGDVVSDFDLSPNGCLMASVSPDRALFLWSFDDLLQHDKQFSRVNVELDEAVHVSFSPDSKAFVTSLKSENGIQVWKVGKKQPETNPPKMTALPFVKYETNTPNISFVGCAVSSSGRFISTFSDDSVLKIWSLKGNLYHTLDTRQGVGSGLAISPSGYLVATYGFTSEVRVFDAIFDNQGNFIDLKRAFELGGHSTSTVGVAFDRENKRMVSVSKDGAWRLWNIDVEYRRNQDPKLISHGTLPPDAISRGSPLPICPAISVHSVIIGTNRSVYCFDGAPEAAGRLERVDDLGGGVQSGVINRVRLDATGEYALVALGRAVLVCSLFGELKLKLKAATMAVKGAKGALAERLNQQIDSLTTKLSACEEDGGK